MREMNRVFARLLAFTLIISSVFFHPSEGDAQVNPVESDIFVKRVTNR